MYSKYDLGMCIFVRLPLFIINGVGCAFPLLRTYQTRILKTFSLKKELDVGIVKKVIETRSIDNMNQSQTSLVNPSNHIPYILHLVWWKDSLMMSGFGLYYL